MIDTSGGIFTWYVFLKIGEDEELARFLLLWYVGHVVHPETIHKQETPNMKTEAQKAKEGFDKVNPPADVTEVKVEPATKKISKKDAKMIKAAEMLENGTGEIITVPAHDEELQDGTTRHHQEYSYVALKREKKAKAPKGPKAPKVEDPRVTRARAAFAEALANQKKVAAANKPDVTMK